MSTGVLVANSIVGMNKVSANPLNSYIESLDPLVYFPMSEGSGTVIYDSANGYNGDYVGVDLSQSVSPFTAPYFDRVNDYANINTASLTSSVDKLKGTFVQFVKPINSTYINTTGITGTTFMLQWVNGNNAITAGKIGAAYYVRYIGAAVSKQQALTFSDAWFMVGATWDTTADEFKAYQNGSQVGATQNSLTAPVDPFNYGLIGSSVAPPINVWDGWIAHTAIWADRVLTPTEMSNIYTQAGI